jgi:hypothetical protein
MKLLLVIAVLFSSVSYAQELTYPELNVTPRATDRIKFEVKDEAGRAWSSHMAVQISALTTFVAGAMGNSSSNVNTTNNTTNNAESSAPALSMGIGAVWLGATVWAGMKYRPYRSYAKKMKKMRYKTKRQKLTAERLAEEEIKSLRRSGKRIRWASSISNLGAAVLLSGDVDPESDAALVNNVAFLTALAPIFFNYHWESVANEQDTYKKKIFAPVAMLPIMKNPLDNSQATGLSLLYTF